MLKAFQSHLLRVLIALVLPFMAPVAAVAAASGAQPVMSGMTDCGEAPGAPADHGMSCEMACPLICVVVPATPSVTEPLVHPDGGLFLPANLDLGGVTVRPDHPPPR